ncbi:pyridoxamine 5'-phosphate oxidase-related FMN-binding protein [Oleidesulfovibrio alaskensis G20]|jgi:hypothetical protein|uniref:Pyridoxamine 5'-phosphate oxidase-related FMN-binding protein n=1 Tax=Oleidesulfovibrio alaskensis (strain ATCC BAA-1058 / DSM 17464 / G20) TaxID=207559 RepID=Q310R1_OLEA2|nr:pyridoxamine 5'-phosphate oxidase family protein [Oleidesulfovibrio alaskensis]ABB38585.2 pyridoxamine 5'-phosphate oxidase-related FMN-binding protein [Oleidesulfovibrio alaskensis G20]MBG0773929.1 pyridoxamine 5'-phosphate oxidase family protein [Oleidesulfovibrio alaskensis]
MLNTMLSMLGSHGLCVLATAAATAGAVVPHCSLMSYVVTGEGVSLYVATGKNSRKYENMRANPVVSILVDNRDTAGNGPYALTLAAQAVIDLPCAERRKAAGLLAASHAPLRQLLETPSCAVVRLDVSEMTLLTDVRTAFTEKIELSQKTA